MENLVIKHYDLYRINNEKELISEKYIHGEPEEIYSKLAVEPVLRTYVLSLIATRIVRTKKALIDFFSKTFWAHHFQDMIQLGYIIEKILKLLSDWNFIKINKKDNSQKNDNDFVSADRLNKETSERIFATIIGKRVAELYIDPLTAHDFISAFNRTKKEKTINEFSFLQMVSYSLEMRPLLKASNKDVEAIEEKIIEYMDNIISYEPSYYDSEYQTYIDSVKTSLFFLDWVNESDEEFLLEKFNVRPGEIRAKLNNADWLLYAASELAKVSNNKEIISEINRMRIRIKNGAKEELLPLLRLKNVGRVRARKLFKNGYKNLGKIKKAAFSDLSFLLGKKTAEDVLEQVGVKVMDKNKNIETKSNKTKKENKSTKPSGPNHTLLRY